VPVYRLILSSRFPRDGRSATMKASSLQHPPIRNQNKQSTKQDRSLDQTGHESPIPIHDEFGSTDLQKTFPKPRE
jgi:hypothetical protein